MAGTPSRSSHENWRCLSEGAPKAEKVLLQTKMENSIFINQSNSIRETKKTERKRRWGMEFIYCCISASGWLNVVELKDIVKVVFVLFYQECTFLSVTTTTFLSLQSAPIKLSTIPFNYYCYFSIFTISTIQRSLKIGGIY